LLKLAKFFRSYFSRAPGSTKSMLLRGMTRKSDKSLYCIRS